MYAVIETGGKQYKVAVGDTLKVEKVGTVGNEIVFDRVLLLSDDQGQVTIGTPVVAGATVKGAVLDQVRGQKIRGFKYKSKVNYRVRYGHRQSYSVVRVDAIQA